MGPGRVKFRVTAARAGGERPGSGAYLLQLLGEAGGAKVILTHKENRVAL